jgi:hypothetical protein
VTDFRQLAAQAEQTATEARAAVDALMRSTCTIREAGPGEPVTDPDSGHVTYPEGPVVYQGKCKIRPAAAGGYGRTAEAGGAQVAPSTFRVSIPWSAPGSERVGRGHIVTVDTSPDAWLPGRKFVVRFSPEAGDYISARRLLCEEPE